MPAKSKAAAAPPVFDIDAARRKFEPVEVRYRGNTYPLGTTAFSILTLPDMLVVEGDEQGKEREVLTMMLQKLPAMLELLNPELGEAIQEHGLTTGEELALLGAVQEVMNSTGKWSFRPA